MIGELFGQYRILSPLGAGGMGEVFLAEDERLGRKVALKFLAPDLARDGEAVERFRNEARVAAGLSHPNIAAIHGFEHHEDRWFHVHEFVEGHTLEQHLAAGPLSIEDAHNLLVDLARGLGHAHSRGVIHRDIKPANVMITPEGSAKILDFGLARRSGSEGMTVPGVVVGTVAFMSPEQIRGETIDTRSDLWSLGVLMYQSLTGKPPFEAPEMPAAMQKIMNEEPRPIAEIRQDTPANILASIERCLKKTPQQRFARAEDLLVAMGMSGDSRISHSTLSMPASGKKSRLPLAAVAGIAIVAIAAVAFWFAQRGGPEATGEPAAINGPVAATVQVEDEFGEVTEQQIVDARYRQKVTMFFVETESDEDWESEAIPLLMAVDLAQDPSVVAASPFDFFERLRRAGSENGHGLPQTLQRKIARERMSPWFVTSTLSRTESGNLRLEQTLQETESGKVANTRTIESASIFELADLATDALRKDLQIPEVLADEFPDLPVQELMTDSEDALRSCVLALRAIQVENDYAGSAGHLDTAVQADPTFAFAHFLHFQVSSVSQDVAAMEESAERMMEYLYRLPAPLQYSIKANYYINIEKKPEKALTVTQMWTQLHPDDENAFRQLAALHQIRNERPEQIAALEEVLRIDPSNFDTMHTIAQLHQDLGQFDESAEWMMKYVEAHPERADGYEELAELHVAMGDREAALAEFEKAELLDDRRVSTIRGIADIHQREGRFDDAARRLEDALRVASSPLERSAVHGQVHGLLLRQGRVAEAIAAQQMAIAAQREALAPVQVLVGAMISTRDYLRIGQTSEAMRIARDLATDLPEQFGAVRALGLGPLYVAEGKTDSARIELAGIEGFVAGYGVEQLRPWLTRFEADICDAEGDYARAVELRRRNVAQDPTSADLKRQLGQALRKLGETDEAIAQLEAASALDPSDPLILVERAQALRAIGAGAAARAEVDRALAIWDQADPDFVDRQEALELRASLQD